MTEKKTKSSKSEPKKFDPAARIEELKRDIERLIAKKREYQEAMMKIDAAVVHKNGMIAGLQEMIDAD